MGYGDKFAKKLQDRFSVATRAKGTKYFVEHRVDVSLTTPTEVCAVVQGTERYACVLHWTGRELAVLCSCPYFVDRGELCKHLWATLLAADACDYLPEARNAPGPKLDAGLLLETVAGSQSELFEGSDGQAAPRPRREKASAPPPPPAWKTQLSHIAEAAALPSRAAPADPWPIGSEIVYILEVGKGLPLQSVVLSVATRAPKKAGGWKYVARPWTVYRQRLASVPRAEDREILSLLAGGGRYSSYGGSFDAYDYGAETFALSAAMARTVLPMVVETGRCFLPFEKEETEKVPLQWDGGEPWRLTLEVLDGKNGWELTGAFRRGDQRMELAEPLLVTQAGSGSGGGTGFLVTTEWVGRLAEDTGLVWIEELRKAGRIVVPQEDGADFLVSLLGSPHLPRIDFPDELRYEEVRVVPRPCLTFAKPRYSYTADRLEARLSFDYEGHSVTPGAAAGGIYEAATRRFILRDPAVEAAAAARLSELGLRANSNSMEHGLLTLARTKLPKVAVALVGAGWHLVAEGKVFRQPGASSVSVVSGVDWFELHGEVDYGGTVARLPQLLAALKRGETMVTLDDGSFGLLPEEWLRRFAGVAAMGEAKGDHLQFRRSQAGLLDALLSAQPAADCDEQFRQVRRQLERFESVAAADQPAGFRGVLRGYQREGLGWMHFLRQFQFGGCLADDMGVGKTAQVLALLETRRELRERGEIDAPSLVVLPKSLIFNWKQEIERFTPRMRVLDYTGIARSTIDPAAYDLILTTYGTLRRDAAQFADLTFDYLILDEAQAIKNARTESAKAARLLRGSHRLAMSGTPVENHLGELWSLFEFLNPGMLGASGVFQGAAKEMRAPSDETSEMLSKALRPFLLRRTKEQVAAELPAKVEQTLYCEMEPRQRALYDELRQHYRDSLLGKIQRDGMAKSKIQVLEALLRLRQAACHPGLVDRKRGDDPSAKFDVLLDSLRDVVEEGHKALVFSQFTTLLGFLAKRLLAGGLAYEYLDGKTVDRRVPVEGFQNDPGCRLFLISLKAGGGV